MILVIRGVLSCGGPSVGHGKQIANTGEADGEASVYVRFGSIAAGRDYGVTGKVACKRWSARMQMLGQGECNRVVSQCNCASTMGHLLVDVHS